MGTVISLTPEDLENALLGTCIMGAGGGGPFTIGEQLKEYLLKVDKPIYLAHPNDVPDTARMAVSAVIGSPDAAESGPFPFKVPGIAFDALDRIQKQASGRSFDHVLAAEVGAGNSMIPLIVGQERGIPTVDGDGAGRAVPALQMVTYAAAPPVPVSPIVLANSLQQVSFSVDSPTLGDSTVRGIIGSGSWTEDAGIALWGMDGSAMKAHVIGSTLTAAMVLGGALRNAIKKGLDPVPVVCGKLDGRVVFRGTIASSTEQTAGGFDFGTVVLAASDGSGRQCRIYNQNENLIAWTSDARMPLGMIPDMLCYLTADGQPFSNADLQLAQGKEVVLIGAPCQPQLRAPVLVSAFLAALQRIGYGGPYVQIEELAAPEAGK